MNKMIEMAKAVKEMDRFVLVDFERLVHRLKGLSATELETLELLLEEEAFSGINQSLKRQEEGKNDEW